MKIIIGAKPTSGLYSRQQPREGAQSVPARVRLGPLPTVQGGWTRWPLHSSADSTVEGTARWPGASWESLLKTGAFSKRVTSPSWHLQTTVTYGNSRSSWAQGGKQPKSLVLQSLWHLGLLTGTSQVPAWTPNCVVSSGMISSRYLIADQRGGGFHTI